MAFFEDETDTQTETPKPAFRRGVPPAEVTETPEVAPAKRANKYPGDCRNCGIRVGAEEGYIAKVGDKWLVEHKDCDQVAKPLVRETGQSKDLDTTFVVGEGRYTIQYANGEYKTLRVRRQDEDANFKPGCLIVSYLSGSNNDKDYTGFAHVEPNGGVRIWRKFSGNHELTEALKVLMGSADAAREAYAEQSGCCSLCGRTLTVPSSLHRGLGPECAKRV
jgi:hypothetical protein